MKKGFLSLLCLVSSSLFASGYLGVHGNFERWSSSIDVGVASTSFSWNAVGGGVGIGMEVAEPVSIEAYFDFLKHLDPYEGAPGVSDFSMTSMHFGGKLAVLLADIVVIKAGAGMCRSTQTASQGGISLSVSSNNFEVVVSGGVLVPLGPSISFDVEGLYRRVFAAEGAVNGVGGQAGIVLSF
ncbi:MAG: outer membrane beta-barrel protein [Oligoflexia bacterium]|nr:outer membrane beta-barrel protein [Oligoflexia bacterium]